MLLKSDLSLIVVFFFVIVDILENYSLLKFIQPGVPIDGAVTRYRITLQKEADHPTGVSFSVRISTASS